MAPPAAASDLQARSLTMSSDIPGATNVAYTINFRQGGNPTPVTGEADLSFQWPAGFDVSAAQFDLAGSTIAGAAFTYDTFNVNTAARRLEITNISAPVVSGTTTFSIRFTGITNRSTGGAFSVYTVIWLNDIDASLTGDDNVNGTLQTFAAPVWSDTTLAPMTVGSGFADGVSANAAPAATYAVTAGALPAGLTLDTATGAITGTPTTGGPADFTITATNSQGSISESFSVVVASAPVWTDQELADVRVGSAYADGVTATGFPAPTYAVTAGTLPAGLTLDTTTGAITGTPTEAGDFSFTITASNSVGSVTKLFTGSTGVAPVWTDQSLAALRLDRPYADRVVATGAPAPTYQLTAGSLPPGLTLDPTTGALTGAPTELGTFTFSITASNAAGLATKQFVLAVTGPVVRGIVDAGGGVADPDRLSELGRTNRSGEAAESVAPTPDGNGAWAVTPRGVVIPLGDAPFAGDLSDRQLRAPAVGIVPTSSGQGYFVVTRDGGVFAFGDAAFRGSAADMPLNAPMEALMPTCSGDGYYLVGGDGGVFAFGGASFLGSMAGTRLNETAVGIVPDCRRGGYWVFARDGGVFAFGDARFFGSLGSTPPAEDIVGMIPSPTFNGYTLIDAAGNRFRFGDA